MVVSGVPQPRPDHLEALARLALELKDTVGGLTDNAGPTVSLRVGLSVGPVVAGVVGTRRFFYDVWGDTQEAYERLKEQFVFDEHGEVAIKGKGKGKGTMRTWFLIGHRPGPQQAPPAELAASSLSVDGRLPDRTSSDRVLPSEQLRRAQRRWESRRTGGVNRREFVPLRPAGLRLGCDTTARKVT